MTFKVNYGFQKAERDRAKAAKKEAKRREKDAATASPSAGDASAPGDVTPKAAGTDEAMPGEENPS